MDLELLNLDIQEFINKNIDKNIAKLALQKNPFPQIEWIAVLNQIEAKAKSKDKLHIGLLQKTSFTQAKYRLNKPHPKKLLPINLN